MNIRTLVLRSLSFHWRSHLGVFLGTILSTAILVGALLVGDSVRHSLRLLALERLGGIHLALTGQARFFRASLADDLSAELHAPVAPAIVISGSATSPDSGLRANRTQVVGISDSFWRLSSMGAEAPRWSSPDELRVNTELMRKLRVMPHLDVILRVDKPSLLSRDAPLSTVSDSAVVVRRALSGVASQDVLGRFSLEANQVPPYNAFLPIERLQQDLFQPGRANVLLVGSGVSPEAASVALWKHWTLDDAGLQAKSLPGKGIELRTDRVFLEPAVGDAAMKALPNARGVLTYFVNEIRLGDRATPYSMVTAMQGDPVPPDLRADEIVINQWLADDLQAKPGDLIRLKYWTVGPMRQLVDQTTAFKVRSILPMQGSALDRDLMPQIPGLADKENCRDWEPGVPIDLKKIRDKDQDYWKKYRGTPKAFIALAAGQRIWNNRFGSLTAVRYPGVTDGVQVQQCIKQALSAGALGLYFVPVREQALAAATSATNFGHLFLGFSFFLIIAALILTVLLFTFAVEQRSEEIGTLLATGFTPKQVRRMLLLEGGVIALLGGIFGSVAAAVYTRAVIYGLMSVWHGAVAGASLQFHAEPLTAIGWGFAGFLIAVGSIWLACVRSARAPVRELLTGNFESDGVRAERSRRFPPGLPSTIMGLIGALAMTLAAPKGKSEAASETFFIAGFLLLIAGIGACRMLITSLGSRFRNLSIPSIGVRNSARRIGRSLAIAGLLAAGSFLVVAIGASRRDAGAEAERKDSGTGGFALYAESALPVYQDLNGREGREAHALDDPDLAGIHFAQMRMRPGDDASCLNLNRAQSPRILGVQPAALAGRFGGDWSKLDQIERTDEIPAIGDANTVTWSLGKSVGDTFTITDERGAARKLRIVGTVAGSILQGSLIISESRFIELFPSLSGYRVFLIDAPHSVNLESLSRAMEDVGLDLTPTAQRLADFNRVENTYLAIFAVLGWLGLLLGSAGLGVVVLRNVMERRGELAILRAVGFRRQAIRWLVFSEHGLLLASGLAIGTVAATLAILPSLRPGTPFGSLLISLLAVLASGILFTWSATAFALRGRILSALRNE